MIYGGNDSKLIAYPQCVIYLNDFYAISNIDGHEYTKYVLMKILKLKLTHLEAL